MPCRTAFTYYIEQLIDTSGVLREESARSGQHRCSEAQFCYTYLWGVIRALGTTARAGASETTNVL